MADFDKALTSLLNREGGYANDPDDAGQETICGISRRYNPGWPGWEKVDAAKKANRLRSANFLSYIRPNVADFYREKYWAPVRGDDLPSQEIATAVFDCAVLCGPGKTIMLLQQSLGALQDGAFGPETMQKLRSVISLYGEREAVRSFRVSYAVYLAAKIRDRPVNAKYAVGWISRALGV